MLAIVKSVLLGPRIAAVGRIVDRARRRRHGERGAGRERPAVLDRSVDVSAGGAKLGYIV